jgi:NTP pyrophosphatase (non-canonical NTP hydrolase)
MNDLNQLILKWADDKGILANGTPEGQLAKTLEELIETAQAVALYDNQSRYDTSERDFLEEVKDGIGDVYVTLVIHAKMNNFENIGIASIDELSNKEAFEQIGKCVIDLMSFRHADTYAYANACLDQLSMSHRLKLNECVEHSYNVISKRNGTMINGVFVKDN